jgi:hypothetical protein
LDRTPDGRECGVAAEHVSELCDTLSGVGAAVLVGISTELVVAQAAHSTNGQALKGLLTCSQEALRRKRFARQALDRTPDGRERGVAAEHVGELGDTLCSVDG